MSTIDKLYKALQDALDTIKTVKDCSEYEAHTIVGDFDLVSATTALNEYETECVRCEPGAIQCCGAGCPVTRADLGISA